MSPAVSYRQTALVYGSGIVLGALAFSSILVRRLPCALADTP